MERITLATDHRITLVTDHRITLVTDHRSTLVTDQRNAARISWLEGKYIDWLKHQMRPTTSTVPPAASTGLPTLMSSIASNLAVISQSASMTPFHQLPLLQNIRLRCSRLKDLRLRSRIQPRIRRQDSLQGPQQLANVELKIQEESLEELKSIP